MSFSPTQFKKVSCCPANAAPDKSSIVEEERTENAFIFLNLPNTRRISLRKDNGKAKAANFFLRDSVCLTNF